MIGVCIVNKQQRRVRAVLNNMLSLVASSDDYTGGFSDILEEGLEKLKEDDFFGSEASTDPRGDGRDGEWSLHCVQFVDEL